jgi:short-subunit dehydrogenase
MLNRSKEGKRCAILNLSSVAHYNRMGTYAMYAATKSFNHTFSAVLAKEVGDKIDVLTVCPGPTLTQMITFKLWYVITPKQHVKATLARLGFENETFGHPNAVLY